MAKSKTAISEGLYNVDFWDKLDIHLGSYVKSPLQLRYVSSKTSAIGRALRHAVVDLLDNIPKNLDQYVENETTVIGTEHRLCHSRRYCLKVKDDSMVAPGSDANDNDEKLHLQISSLAPTIFYQLREDIGISNDDFRRSFSDSHLKDFTNPGKSGSLMYKTFDDLFLLKTLRDYEARLLMQILADYRLQLTRRSTILNRYVGLYSVSIDTPISSIEVYVAVMANAFTPSLRINEIFDLKGSKIKRKLAGGLSAEKLHKLKDMDFMSLYPAGIRIPTNIYERLKLVIANDTKVLRKLNITDFSVILGIRHLDMSEEHMVQRGANSGVAALMRMSTCLALTHLAKAPCVSPSLKTDNDQSSLPTSYLKPLRMLDTRIDTNLYYDKDSAAYASLPIPGIINKSNQRVYIYLVLVDMLQTFDNFKLLDQTFRRLTDYNRHMEYSVIEPDDYERRINQFLFQSVFVDAQDDFPWAITDVSKPVAQINKDSIEGKVVDQWERHTRRRARSAERSPACDVVEFRL